MLECNDKPESPIEGVGEHRRNPTLRAHSAAALGLSLFLLLIAAWPSHAAIAVVQTAFCEAQGATTCSAGPITSTNGNLFIASSAYCCASFTSITDSKSNTYSNSIAELASLAGDAKIRQDYKANGTGGASHTFTITGGSASFFASLSILEVSGASASTPLDQTATAQTVTTMSHATAATAATAQANELLTGLGTTASLGAIFTTDTGAGWTERLNITTDADSQGIISGSRIVSAISTYQYTFTTDVTVSAAVGISTWKEAAANTRQRCIGCDIDKKVIGR